MATINYDQFKQTELKVVKILEAERVEDSDKLLRLKVALGDSERQIIAGIGKAYEPATLVGRQIVIVANLEPRSLMGLESQGMILAAHGENGEAVLLSPDKEVPVGSEIS
ncbi:MAG: Methionine-tRNA ligase [Parcubacteria group bacterium GW2011_GWC1_43_11b]|uniref:Methionine--tRNA ligase n=2 Tax=Candidatus Vogeliibacteriota TaxID=1817922 RepID=A0A1G2QDM1_9BACT|nr:MAG: Methionine-tRNA ligase [Parcubacteria group bacterium GW2011_GWB1_42_9]KKS89626.1 MAG: Methionine-tRNA ligase [Parcubacteria group bacterium GW2011_GWC1_43_11b]KKT10077.1 MAG: Methionine-tRNA ligase [Parcubacteria group bacterium GW2011_GWA1_43_21]OHA58061.1 MAG: methionine--tRNA ligase subunit beta [Candidatus Vogelbacteria bacterium RIFOXYB1_FULL_42_16]OHA58331.1 MAG: methionine--tRNA ligase subunit beta [Candidatus Vogelbacteria bacterium RIFOXYD1_FULL_42_15]